MLSLILIILILFWFFGYGPFLTLRLPLITLNSHSITLWDILIFILIIWLIDLLPAPARTIAGVILLIWILGTLGIIAIPILSNLIIISMIVGLVIYITNGN
ncbi:MAG TPA: hypothetical protein VL401_02125 [Alphaproteobacteria bacterium]|nr:hypothetical protein [Alphaproteobacteria bacterium]